MVISSSVFIISIIGIGSLMWLTSWERRRGSKVAAGIRARLDAGVIKFSRSTAQRISAIENRALSRAYHATAHVCALIVLRLIKMLEKKMVHIVDGIRGRRELARREPTSDFLKQVSEHKQGLSGTRMK